MEQRARIEISKDRTKAHLIIEPLLAEDAPTIDIKALIAQAEVKSDLTADQILSIQQQCQKPNFLCTKLIAQGLAVENGKDGQFESNFELGPQIGALMENGRIDFREQLRFVPAEKGAVLGQYTAPEPGRDGRDVTGRSLVAKPGRNPLPRLGQGVRLNPNGEVIATRSGAIVLIVDKFLDVDACVEHQGPVDIHSGNLNTAANIIVKGDLESGYSVRAKGAVVLKGDVNGGSISAAAALSVSGCIFGSAANHFGVRGLNAITAKRAQGALIETAGRLEIERDLIDCQVRCERAKIGDGKTGKIRGGKLIAEFSVTAGEVGSPGGAATFIQVGVPWVLEEELRALELKTGAQARHKRQKNLVGSRQSKNMKVSRALAPLSKSVNTLKLELRRRRQELLKQAQIELGCAYRGTQLMIGNKEHTIKETTNKQRFLYDSDKNQIIGVEFK